MSITTKTGDGGKSRWMGREEDKDGVLLEAIGAIDELKAVARVIKTANIENEMGKVEEDLWGIMGELSCGVVFGGYDERVREMEEEIVKIESGVRPISKFVGFESEVGVKLNWVRTVARRAERRVVGLSKRRKVDPRALVYFNRLSDYLFMLGRRAEED